MAGRIRSHKQAQAQHAAELRAAGQTWAEVAAAFQREYQVNARVAVRLAHGWSQGDVADRWNTRWPDDLKTFKNISYWERWPAASGYTPSLDVLTKLADLYQCHVADLLADGADHRAKDEVFQARTRMARLPAVATSTSARPGQDVDSDALRAFMTRLDEADVQDLAKETAIWATQIDSSIDRRGLLLKLGFALTLAAATPYDVTVSAAQSSSSKGTATDLSGVWRSEYSYYSTGRGREFSSVHYVVLRQDGDSLSVTSLPHSTGSELSMSLSLDGMTATGSWEERTSPTGYYKGAEYRGAMQLLVSPSGGLLTGRWLGFGKNFQINNGDWELRLETRSLDQPTLTSYELKE
jgi:transcriptional regulator with XRE-family HTH domain